MVPQKRAGFSLIEILVVIAIIALLLAMMFPVISNVRMMAQRTACLSNLRETALVFHAYATDHRGNLPLANDTNPRLFRPDTHAAVEAYFEGPYSIFYCPSPAATSGPELWDVCRTWDANHYSIGYVYVGNLDVPNCWKFVNGDPVASMFDPLANVSPILFDVCAKSRSGNWWLEFPHDGVNSRNGMNQLYGDMHAEWVPFSEMELEYTYISPINLWW